MRSDPMKTEEANAAAWEAAKGGLIGAAKWGAAGLALGGIGMLASPVYRGLTIQFKLYIQMSAMVLGSMMEADYRLREFEARVRMEKRRQRDRAKWERFEQEFLQDDGDGKKK